MVTDDFERDLRTRLTALAEPVPATPHGLIPAIRHTAVRQRRHTAGSVVVATLLLIVGLGAAWPVLTRGDAPPAGSVAAEPAPLLSWPLRESVAGQIDGAAIERAWTGHRAVRPLYVGDIPGNRQVVIAQGRTATDEVRVAVLVGPAGAWQVRLEVPGFATEPDYLLVAVDPVVPNADSMSTLVVLAAPDAFPVRINDKDGGAVAFLSPNETTHRQIPADQLTHLRLFSGGSESTQGNRWSYEWSLRQWGQTAEPSSRVTLLISDKQIR